MGRRLLGYSTQGTLLERGTLEKYPQRLGVGTRAVEKIAEIRLVIQDLYFVPAFLIIAEAAVTDHSFNIS
jgi:hypothetical protein